MMEKPNNHRFIDPEIMKYLSKISPDVYSDYVHGDDFEELNFTHEEFDEKVDEPAQKKNTPSNSKIKSIHRGHRERVREKFFNYGLDCFSEYEVLEFLLFHTIPMKDTNEIAHRLIERFGTLKGVFNADYHDLMEVNGISEVSAALITMQREIFKYLRTKAVKKERLGTSAVAARYCRKYFENHVEESTVVIVIDDERNVQGVEVICKGTETESYVLMRKIIRVLIRYRSTSAIIAHNHPGVKLANPSNEDYESTLNLKQTLENLGIALVDHIVCTDTDYFSMMDNGYI